MSKEKFGKQFYIGSLVLAVVLFIGVRIFLPKDSLTDDSIIRTYNLVNFIVFGFVFPVGTIVREFCLLNYIKAIMIVKIIVFGLIFTVGLVLFFAIPTVSVSNLILYFSYGSLILILIPSFAFRKLDNDKM